MTIDIKQRAHELIEALPDNATWQELLYAFELRADVEAGLADAIRCATRLPRTGPRPTSALAKMGLAGVNYFFRRQL